MGILVTCKNLTGHYCLTLTNYDQDHFSGLPIILNQAHINTVLFPKNLEANEIWNIKPVKTQALKNVQEIRSSYVYDVQNYYPPYKVFTHHLRKEHFQGQKINTNYLSQIVFLEYLGNNICIAGDLEKPAWDLILQDLTVRNKLTKTDIFIAAHHGRKDGYAEEVFTFCYPECIVISDKSIMHDTQKTMAQLYASHIIGNGIYLNDNYLNPRKVLTTRSDGNIWVRINNDGSRCYRTF